MTDYVIRATAAEGQIRAFAATTRDLVEEMRVLHNTFPICTAAVGRLMTAGLMMAADLKGERDLLTLSVKGDGPIRGLTVTMDSHGHVKGYCTNPNVMLPANAKRHLNVGGAVGGGMLSVIRDTGLREPYVGQTQLVSGEIGEDIAAYFVQSEQIPSAVGLGVLMTRENTVHSAGGFIIQLMPGAEESLIAILEKNILLMGEVTGLLERGKTPEDLLRRILGELDLKLNEKLPVSYRCDCSRERVQKALISIGRDELQSLVQEGKSQEVVCDFCGKKYNFSPEELGALQELAR